MSGPLRIGLLQCGYVHPDARGDDGDYPELFASLLAPFDLELVTYDVQAGPVPDDVHACEGWLVSGSASSAYDDEAWIGRAEGFLRDVVIAGVPLVAVCFGHQLLAQALGGRVAKAPDGWGAGVHEYRLLDPASCPQAPASGTVRIVASHQDQVVALPEGAVVVAATDHCPVAAYTLGPDVLAIQPHPEFPGALSGRLIGLRRDRIGADTADAALATLDEPLDQHLVAAWMAAVWRRARPDDGPR